MATDIKKYNLDPSLYALHKEAAIKSSFGMDSTNELLDDGFGLYSTANLKSHIGPVKTEYFRIGLMIKGSVSIKIGLEGFRTSPNDILFGFPGQIFSLYDRSEDFFCYYMLFNEAFIGDSEVFRDYRFRFPFLHYSGVQCFSLTETEAKEVEAFIIRINEEIKRRQSNMSQAIRLYIQLILLLAARRYGQTMLNIKDISENPGSLFTRFIKLVSEHYLAVHKVSDYARMLHVSPDHLNRVIKSQSDKTAHELIDEMLLNEAKAHLLHSSLTISEIAYKLDFTDPSHFNKFFRKYTGTTPFQYRNKSE